MWIIFLLSVFIIAIMAMVVAWIGHKLLLSMRKDDERFNKKYKKERK